MALRYTEESMNKPVPNPDDPNIYSEADPKVYIHYIVYYPGAVDPHPSTSANTNDRDLVMKALALKEALKDNDPTESKKWDAFQGKPTGSHLGPEAEKIRGTVTGDRPYRDPRNSAMWSSSKELNKAVAKHQGIIDEWEKRTGKTWRSMELPTKVVE